MSESESNAAPDSPEPTTSEDRSLVDSTPTTASTSQPEIPASKDFTAFVFQRLSSDAVLIATISVLAYLFVFSYEAGVCSAFGIPFALISTNLVSFFVIGSVIFLGLFVPQVRLALDAVSFVNLTDEEFHFFQPLVWGLPALTFGVYCITSGPIALASTLIFYLILRWLVRKRRQAPEQLTKEEPSGTPLIEVMSKRIGRRGLTSLVVLVYLLMGTFWLGHEGADNLHGVMITKGGAKQYAVLRIYGDNIIAAPIDTLVFPPGNREWHHVIVESGLKFYKVGDKDTPEFVIDREGALATLADKLGVVWYRRDLRNGDF